MSGFFTLHSSWLCLRRCTFDADLLITPYLTPLSGETPRTKVCRGWFSLVPVLLSKINAGEWKWRIKIRLSAIPSESESVILLKSMWETMPHFCHNHPHPVLTSSPEKILHDSNVLNLKANQNNGGKLLNRNACFILASLFCTEQQRPDIFWLKHSNLIRVPLSTPDRKSFFFLHQTLRRWGAEVMSGVFHREYNWLWGPALNANNCMFCMWHKISHDSLLLTHSRETLYPILHWSRATLSCLCKGY